MFVPTVCSAMFSVQSMVFIESGLYEMRGRHCTYKYRIMVNQLTSLEASPSVCFGRHSEVLWKFTFYGMLFALKSPTTAFRP